MQMRLRLLRSWLLTLGGEEIKAGAITPLLPTPCPYKYQREENVRPLLLLFNVYMFLL